MSQSKAKKIEPNQIQQQIIFDPKRDINPFWKSSLFSDVYLKNDLEKDYKELWEGRSESFEQFCEEFVKLCRETSHECFEKWREADTIKNWIVPVMELLGWEDKSEGRQNSYMDNESFCVPENGKKQTLRPDLLYFDRPKHKAYTQQENDNERKLREVRNKRTGAKLVLEAKYWGRLSKMNNSSIREDDSNDSASALGPELQTLRYMNVLEHDFGILTDGKNWRLFHKDLSQGVDRRSYDFDLGKLRKLALDLGSHQNEGRFKHYSKYFYYFFSKKSLIQSEEDRTVPFVNEIFEYSKKYALSIEDDLKKRFILTMGVACNSLIRSCKEIGEDADLGTIRNVAESHLFNILFVKSCEVRGVLPVNSSKYVRLSIHEVIETMDEMDFDPAKDWDDYLLSFRATLGPRFDWGGYELFKRFINLYEIIHDGTAKTKDYGFEIQGFKESIFTKDEWKLAKRHKINNGEMIKILHNLNFIESQLKTRKYQQIPYSYFTPRQLGGIYESFLEYQLEKAEFDMVFVNNRWQKANLKSKKVLSMGLNNDQVVKKGELFFSPDNKERRMTGSYYTPDFIVKYIVEKSIGPVIENMTSNQLLKVKVCDPALGSGHFLAGALDYLVSSYREKWAEENNDDLSESCEDTAQKILHSCLYGVDLNPRAIKLAKLSFWLTTSRKGEKLERLDDQIKHGDSLCGFKWKKEFKKVFSEGGFDVVIGNPPYLKEANHKAIFDKYRKSNISKYIEGKMDLCYAFACKSIDLLKDSGRHSFILPSTWVKGSGAKVMRQKLSSETTFETIINFNDYKVFEDAAIQTMIYVVRKEKVSSSVIELLSVEDPNIDEKKLAEKMKGRKGGYSLKVSPGGFSFLSRTEAKFVESVSKANVGYLCKKEIGNGVDVLQDFVTKKHLQKLGDQYSLGQGIFVLNEAELKRGKFTKKDLTKIKPYYTTSEIGRYKAVDKNRLWLIYADKEVRTNIEKFPGIKKHLKQFESVLTSVYKPYGLHRPRNEKLFSENAILAVRKTKEPCFSLVDYPHYVSRMFLIIQPKGWNESNHYLTAVLNSSFVSRWLKVRGKKQGTQLQVDQGPLCEIPIRKIDFSNELEAQVHEIISKMAERMYSLDSKSNTFKEIDTAIDKLVTALYEDELVNLDLEDLLEAA